MRSSLLKFSSSQLSWGAATGVMIVCVMSCGAMAETPGETLLVRRDADIYCRSDADAPVCSEAFAWNFLYVANIGKKQPKDFYPVSLKPGGSLLGWVRKSDAAVWPHRIAMGAGAGVQQANVYCAAGDIKPAAKDTTKGCWLHKPGDPMLPVLRPTTSAGKTLRVLRMQRRLAAPATSVSSDLAPRDPATIRPPFQRAPYQASRVPVLPTLLDVAFVIQAEEPHKTIRAIGSAVEAWLPAAKQLVDARFAVAVVGSDGAKAPFLYPLSLQPGELVHECKSHNSSKEPPAPATMADSDSQQFVVKTLRQVARRAKWREQSLRHIVLLAPDDTASLDDKNFAAAEQLINALQPRTSTGVTLHIRAAKGNRNFAALELAAGNSTPGTVRKYGGGVISQLLGKFATGLNRRPPRQGAIYAVSAPASIAAAMPALRQAPPWSPQHLSIAEETAETPGVGYVARGSRLQGSSFQPFVLVEHRELTMFAAYLEFTVNGLRRQESGSKEVARTLANMQRFEVNLIYGRPLSSPAAGPSGFAAELNSLPATTRVLSATAAKLASMSQTDYSNWIKEAARCHTAIRKLLDNDQVWHPREKDGDYTWLPMRDLP